MEYEVVWNGALSRATGQLLCGEWEQRRDNPWAELHAPDRETFPYLGAAHPRKGRGLLMRSCVQCGREYKPRTRAQKYCSPRCAWQAPKATAFVARVGRGTYGP